jgi:N-acyl-D-aspartate/D-glutamate deacylase
MTLLIRNAEIYDGRGGEPFLGDIFISGDRISAIGSIPARHAKAVIESQGLKVCPGFIDAFTKTDHYCGILDEPEQKEFLKNGVTTVIGGQEGVSLAPLFPGNLDLIEEWSGRHRNFGWHSAAEFLRYLAGRPLGVNFGTRVGYETVRRALATSKKKLSKSEATFLNKILKTAIAEGCLGISRPEDKEGIVIPFLRHIAPARTFLPSWIRNGSLAATKEAVADSWLRAKMIPEIQDLDFKRIVVVQAPGHDPLVGNTLDELSRLFRLKNPKAALMHLLLLTGCKALVAYPAATPAELRADLTRPEVMLGTAGASFGPGRKPKAIFVDENASALSYFLSLAVAEGLMPLAAAVQKITAVPARRLGLKDRGELLEGKFADIVGFTLDSRSCEICVKFVVLNGKLVMKEGEFLTSAGRILTSI